VLPAENQVGDADAVANGGDGGDWGRPRERHDTHAMAIDIDPHLLDVLACPADDHGPLRPGSPTDPDAPALTCTQCGRSYPVRDGIPVLLLSEADGEAS
jgi:uncharacterized protein YbaR (Trm112 family)